MTPNPRLLGGGPARAGGGRLIQVRKIVRWLLVLAAIGVSLGAAVNVYGDDAAVRLEAEGVACPRGCPKATQVSYERSPVAETITYVSGGGEIVRVSCTRAAVLVGPYSCARE